MRPFSPKAALSRLVVMAVVAVSASAAMADQAGAAVTIQQSGSVGFWGGNEGDNHCANLLGAYVKPIEPYVSRAPQYPNHTQTIYMISRIDTWTGSSWATYAWDSWQSRTAAPGTDWVLFSTRTQPVAAGRYYRVVQFYEWWIGGTRIGSVTNLFDQSEYMGAWVAETGTSPSFCFTR